MQVKFLGVERRRRWSDEDKARIFAETLIPAASLRGRAAKRCVTEPGFRMARQARAEDRDGEGGSVLLPVEMERSQQQTL